MWTRENKEILKNGEGGSKKVELHDDACAYYYYGREPQGWNRGLVSYSGHANNSAEKIFAGFWGTSIQRGKGFAIAAGSGHCVSASLFAIYVKIDAVQQQQFTLGANEIDRVRRCSSSSIVMYGTVVS